MTHATRITRASVVALVGGLFMAGGCHSDAQTGALVGAGGGGWFVQ